MARFKIFLLAVFFTFSGMVAGAKNMKLGLLVYNGGGDWYANPTSLKNLAIFCNEQLHTNFDPVEAHVEVGSPDIFNYPFIHMTGHGRWALSDAEAQNLRKYLTGGGFLHIDDNYGLDPYVRPQMKKVFPELDFVELPVNYPIYHQKFDFPGGLPKIHEHDGKRAQGFGLIYKGRLVCFYDYECDLGNGWEDYGTYAGDTQETRLKALKMGANMIQFVLTQ